MSEIKIITKDKFADYYAELAEAFGKQADNTIRLQRSFNYVAGLPANAVKMIIEDFIDNSRTAPLPQDFDKAARAWKSHFFKANGYYYGASDEGPADEKLDCENCLDTGIVKIVHHQPDGFAQLMRCDCVHGSRCNSLMPQWHSELSGAFKRERFEVSWFNPKISETDSDESAYSKVWAKVEEWQKFKRKAVQYWHDLGYKP